MFVLMSALSGDIPGCQISVSFGEDILTDCWDKSLLD